MEQIKTVATPLTRVTVLDALRGFSLLGVILMHMLQHYSISPGSGSLETKPLFPYSDEVIGWIGQNIISGKFINVFAFLFGLSFFIQMDRAARKGIDFRKRFVWRMVILLAIGQIGNMFYSGEIISLYAVYGVLLVILYNVRGWILMLIFSLILIGTPRVLQVSYDKMVKTEQSGIRAGTGAATHKQVYRMPVKQEKPSFINSVKHNFTAGLQSKLNYQFGMFGRGYLTFALFILGLVVGRTGFFEKVNVSAKRNLILFAAFVLVYAVAVTVISLSTPANLFALLRSGEPIPLSLLFIMALNDIATVALSCTLVMGFIMLYKTKRFGKYLDMLSPYGRMGLTNYEVQSVIGCFMFSMWSFGSFFGRMGATELFVTGILIYIIQLLFSRYWLKLYLYGPLEWLWRSATYRELQPFRKRDNI